VQPSRCRIGRSYTYRLNDKGIKAALILILFHKRVCGPLANSLFHHWPDETLKPTARSKPLSTRPIKLFNIVLELLVA